MEPVIAYVCATCGNRFIAGNFEAGAEEGTLCPECSCIFLVEPDESE